MTPKILDDPDRIVAEILRADDLFLAEVGRLTLLFSHIEDHLVKSAQRLLDLIGDSDRSAYEDAVSAMAKLRILEKRNLLVKLCGEIGNFYLVDHGPVIDVLHELGNLNQFRRAVVHGSIRWLASEGKPVFMESHGHTLSAWPDDIAELNLKILNWLRQYFSEQAALMRSVMNAYVAFSDRWLERPSLPAPIWAILQDLRTRASGGMDTE